MNLEAVPQARSVRVSANGITQHYLDRGAGEPGFLAIPGITSPAATFEFVAEPLSRHHRVVTVDVRGRGLSDKPPAGYGLEDYVADAAALIEVAGLSRPTVLGHSMGARIAAALAARHPELVGAAILADPPLTGPGRDAYPFPLDPYVESLRKAQAGATAEDMRPYFPSWTEEQLALRARWLATCSEQAVVETYRNFHEEDFFEPWSRISVPVLLVYGEESPVVTASGLEDLAAANPRARMAGVSGAGHMIPWDNLPDFVSVVLDFHAERRP
jgi:N-formylmaleamate deformylase